MFLAFEQENRDSVNGSIQCESKKGHGTTFIVVLEYDIVPEEYMLEKILEKDINANALVGKKNIGM